ncbi:hemoglobin subunit alpha-B [Sparus aurata]|uniref:Alpha-1 globin n=1 Tax=Sparus aurata TaxID=8175 RepID=Q19LH3_SPAAU|nr:hemoglobin subunit alpha-B-like [Sparus aurata]ABF67512.1 alpha-1 globin [Sparus aurata]
MSLSDTDKARVRALWAKVQTKAPEIGGEALGRMLVAYPQTKAYFSHWGTDLNVNHPSVQKHGAVIMTGIARGVKYIDDLTNGLSALSELHAFKLRVDPGNFKILAHNLIVVIASYFPADFTPEAHVSFDKFLMRLAFALSERYR